jgi:hypothetical protein
MCVDYMVQGEEERRRKIRHIYRDPWYNVGYAGAMPTQLQQKESNHMSTYLNPNPNTFPESLLCSAKKATASVRHEIN